MFRTIVWASDGSRHADRALPLVRELAAQSGARVVIAHNVELMVGRAGGYPVHLDQGEIEARLERQAAELREAGVDVGLEVARGGVLGPAYVVSGIAERAGADLIVTGTRGHSPVAGLLLGSVVQRLLHIAPCPVLAVPAAADVAVSDGARGEAVTAS